MIRIVALALVGVFTFFYNSFNQGEINNVEREVMIQNAVMSVLNQAHFDPKPLDDEFSKEAFSEFLETLDGRKRFFTQEDLELLKPFELKIDDQVQGGNLEFFDLANELLEKRIDEAELIYKDILGQSFDFSIQEEYEFDAEKKDFPANSAELKERWRKSLKYDVMTKLESRLDGQKDKEESEKKSYDELSAESAKAVLDNYDDWYKNYRKVRRSDRFESYLNTIAHLFDPHSDYYNPKEKQDFDINMGGKLEGIGARLRTEGDYTKVVSIVPGGPAWKEKQLEVDDIILKVKQETEEPVDILGMRIDDVVSKIRGDKGTLVVLTTQKQDGAIIDITIERDIVNIEESFAKSAILDKENIIDNIGYIHLPKFYSSFEGPDGTSCAADIAKEIEKLKKNDVRGIILDLRNNGGGSLRDVVDMTGLFIEDGPVVQVKPRDRKAYVYRDEDESVLYDGPLVVMVNSFSASASEILAAALQDYKRAVIVGTQTFGKGTVQRFIDLDKTVRNTTDFKPLGEVKITMQKFYRVNGGSTQQKGVTPDIILPDRYSQIEVGEREYPHSMEWSEIAGLEFDQAVYKVDNMPLLISKSSDRLKTNDQFNMIDKQATLLKENRDKTKYSLRLEDYQAYLAEKDAEADQFEGLFKDDVAGLVIKNMESDLEAINFDESTMARNEDWIKDLKKDIYLDECVAIINDLIKGAAYTKQ